MVQVVGTVIDAALEEERARFEEGLLPLALIDRRQDAGHVLVILTKPGVQQKNSYYCHRYFPLGNDWVCSVDGDRVPLQAVFSWLTDPGAAATQEDGYVIPRPAGPPQRGLSAGELVQQIVDGGSTNIR